MLDFGECSEVFSKQLKKFLIKKGYEMKKTFITLGCTFLFMVLAFTQSDAQITISKSRSAGALLAEVTAAGSKQTKTVGYYGADTIIYFGETNGFGLGDLKRNVVKSGPLGIGASFKFEDSPYDGSIRNAFKFNVNDTIFISLQSKRTPITANKTAAQQNFEFNAAANRAVGFKTTGSGASSFKFHVILSNGTSSNINYSNFGKIDLSGVTGDTVKIVIDQVAPSANGVNTQLIFSDISIKPKTYFHPLTDDVYDALVVFYGRSATHSASNNEKGNVNIGRAPVQVKYGNLYCIFNMTPASSGNKNSISSAAQIMIISCLPDNENFKIMGIE